MRFFPGAPPRRAVAALIAVGVALGALTLPALADDDLKSKQKRVEDQIEQAHDHLEHSSAKVRRTAARLASTKAALATARGELSALRRDLADARAKDARMQLDLDAATQELMLATAELVAGRAAVDQQRTRVEGTVNRFYTRGDPQLRALASYLGANSPEAMIRGMAAERSIVGYQDSIYQALEDAEDDLASQQRRVKDAKKLVAAKRREAADQLRVVEGLYADAQAKKQEVEQLHADSRAARQRAMRARQADLRKLRALEAREKKIRQQILAAAQAAGGGSYNGDTGGLLARPVNGPVTSSFGYRKHPIYGYWGLHDGIDFGAACGQPLFAGAAGTVVRTYYDEVYGNRLYLSIGNVNGANVTLVYNHLSRYRVSGGARVGRGDVVGYVGTTGWSTGCHLHFTVLRNGNPVDPAPYL